MTKNLNDAQTFEELVIKNGRRKDVWYIAQGWKVPLRATREYWKKKYGIDPKKAVVKKTLISSDD